MCPSFILKIFIPDDMDFALLKLKEAEFHSDINSESKGGTKKKGGSEI